MKNLKNLLKVRRTMTEVHYIDFLKKGSKIVLYPIEEMQQLKAEARAEAVIRTALLYGCGISLYCSVYAAIKYSQMK